jgi:glutathione reductase (NADPH)
MEPEASEVINLFALAMRTGLRAGDLKRLVSTYPSAGSDVLYLI